MGRRGNKGGKDSEKGLCFLIRVRCSTDVMLLKERASLPPFVVSSGRGDRDSPLKLSVPSESGYFPPSPSAHASFQHGRKDALGRAKATLNKNPLETAFPDPLNVPFALNRKVLLCGRKKLAPARNLCS